MRLVVIRNGFPPPQTQIPLRDEFGVLVAVVDLGWEDMKIAMDYEGEHIRVTAEDTEGGIVRRLSAAWQRRT